MSGSTCQRCAAVVAERRARWCPVCGSLLPAASVGPVRRRSRWWSAVGVALVLVGAVAVLAGVAGGTGRLELPVWTAGPAPEPDPEVELPPPSAVAEPPEVVSCEPVGCERWRLPVPPGRTWASDERIYHVTIRELLVIDAATGALVAEHVLEPPEGGRWAIHPTVAVVQDGLLLLEAGAWLSARDADDGTERWRSSAEPSGVAMVERTNDVLVLTGREHMFSSGEQPPVPRVTALDADTGQVLWQDSGVPYAVGPLVVLGAIEGDLRIVDAHTGELWITRPNDTFIGTSGLLAAFRVGEVVEVLAWPSTEPTLRLEVAPDEWVWLHDGERLITRREGPGITVRDARSGAQLGSLDGDLVGLVAIGEDTAVARRVGDELIVDRVDPAWRIRWRAVLGFPQAGFAHLVGFEADHLAVVVDPDGSGLVSWHLIDPDTGEVLRQDAGERPAPWASRHPWSGPLEAERIADGFELRGPAGSILFPTAVGIVSQAPLVVIANNELIAIDETLLYGPAR